MDFKNFKVLDDLEEGYRLVTLNKEHEEYEYVESKMKNTIKEHKNGIAFSNYSIIKISKVLHSVKFRKYRVCIDRITKDMGKEVEEKQLFHGSPFSDIITQEGFKVELANADNMFGAGIYFAPHSSKSNQYAFGITIKGQRTITKGCPKHNDKACYKCVRTMLLCRVCLGNILEKKTADRLFELPAGYHSIMAVPCAGGVRYPEYAIYDSDQAYPGYIIEYTIDPP